MITRKFQNMKYRKHVDVTEVSEIQNRSSVETPMHLKRSFLYFILCFLI